MYSRRTTALVTISNMSIANSRIPQFMSLVNERLLGGAQSDALQALWQEVTYYKKCEVVLAKGDRAGQACNKACVKGKLTCMCHMERPEKKVKVEKPRCATESCKRFCLVGLTTCRFHQPKEAPAPCGFTLQMGPRKGEACNMPSMNGMTCRRHIPKAQIDTVKEEEVPMPPLEQVEEDE